MRIILFLILSCVFYISPCFADNTDSWYKTLSPQFGGHIRARGNISWQDEKSVYSLMETGPYYDGSGELRLKNTLFFGNWGIFDTHYEAVFSGGDTRSKGSDAALILSNISNTDINISGLQTINDNRRLFNLTGIIDENDEYVLYHRLDRLSLTLQPQWGTVRIGRQALTWGNGMLFNPLDLFSPFAPTDIIRDYKIGDDMVTARFPIDNLGELQFLYIPRRNLETKNPEWDSSSLAAKFHFSKGTTEYDLVAGRNYENYIIGLGNTGYLKDAAWRMDTSWTILPDKSNNTGYLSIAANMDYSWVWWGKNFYGFIELYYNGLGNNNYKQAVTDTDLAASLSRGEIFTLGRTYMAGNINMEIHPLFNFHLTLINNLADPSGLIQPRFIWSISEDIEALAGGNINYGGTDTEFGGFKLPGTDFVLAPAQSCCLWITCFF